jgi:hypothetical protein
MPVISFNPSPVFYVIIGVLAGMIIGWIIGYFDSNNRSSNKIHASELKSEAVIKEANAKIAQAEQQIALASQSSQKPQDDPGLLRLKNNNGRISLEMDGALITDSLSPDKKKRLIELITVFRPYLEGGLPSQATIQSIAPNQTPPVPAPVQVVSQPLQPAPKKTETEKSISSLSIVGQIDTVLQKRLMNSPLAGSGIRLQDSLLGGVEVYVGARKFESIDDVPDEAIKAEIRAAIAEWEHKFTPGM